MNAQLMLGAVFLIGPLMLSDHWLARVIGMGVALGVAIVLL